MTTINEAVRNFFDDYREGCNNLITCKDLYKKIGANEDLFILDIRKEEDFKESHIEGAKNIFWYDVGNNLDAIPKDKKIIVVCYSGQSAGQITTLLRLLGYDACSLKGGMNNGWNEESLPLDTGCCN